MSDVALRLSNRVQLTTDGLKAYLEAVENNFDKIHYAQLVKMYGGADGMQGNEKNIALLFAQVQRKMLSLADQIRNTYQKAM